MNDFKPYFISCSIERVKYLRGKYINNHPVNLSLCKSISKDKYAWYPDNVGLPSIKFNGCDKEWVYNDNDMRDADYSKIINNKTIE